ncbi:Bug family tripartite tricarboxylate transporter substrate binding protein [Achromobacter insuavis]|uniref:Bug family tripartite tricarboxylate transporter substrate binding protein n=1 Tax=Achromobacter insuavis TaxID=1287735 RepID=UPI001F140434|nr:tripartite tricarboxylate transporter substrate binding protein [Achromobacter insuavis]
MNAIHRLAAAATLGLALAGTAQAQDAYPSKPIKVIVHTLPGASSDVLARAVSKTMGEQLGQSFVVENRSGAGGAIGVDAVAKAAPDGYTLLAGASSAMVMLPIVLSRKLPYDENKDFAPIGVISRSPFVLVASKASGIRSVEDLIARAKAEPGKLTYGSAGPGTNPHLLGELLSQLAGIQLSHIPYKGPAAAESDLIGGTIDILFDTPSSALPYVKAGKTVAIAATSDARVADAPDVPTVAELGYPSLTLYGWTALYAPAATPPAVQAKLREALRQALKTPALREFILNSGNDILDLYGDDLLKMQVGMQDFWRDVVKARGIRLD